MIHQKTCNGAGSVDKMIMNRKRKRKRHFNETKDAAQDATTSVSGALPSAVTSEAPGREGGSNGSFQPKKRRRKKNKKKASEEGPAEGIKPVLIVKKPEDYSANWKMLKELITKDDKKPHPIRRPKGKTTFPKNKNRDFKTGKKQQEKRFEDNSKTSKDETQEKPEEDGEELDIWFDNVDPILLEETHKKEKKVDTKKTIKKPVHTSLVKEESTDDTTKVVAMDCEMVGVGINGKDSILARVSIVNHFGKVLYDKYVKPTEEVVDYRTAVSGIRPADIENGCDFSVVQKEVAELLEGRILVGHSVHNDLRSLFLSHPRSHIRDTSKYKEFKRIFGGKTPSLKKLVDRLLSVQIQQGEHSSVQDAQAAMRLYTMHRKTWEKSRSNKYKANALRAKAAAAKREQQPSQEVDAE